MSDPDIERTFAFLEWFAEHTSTRTQRFAGGTAFFHDDFPRRYDSNFLLLNQPLRAASVSSVSAEADRLLEGFSHREVVVADDTEGARLAGGLIEAGYSADHLVIMSHRRAPDREPVADVEEADADAVIPLATEVNVLAHGGMSVPDARMLAQFRRVLVELASARFFIARVAEDPAAYCELYVHDGVAQVEDVNTLERYRGRGLARAVVLRAVGEARAAGADLVFLYADVNDWPQRLYEKLGFDPIGHFWSFVRASA